MYQLNKGIKHMMTKNCLNCKEQLIGTYCYGCGQKADTHRITFKNFIFHDVLHGTFHLERGILFTAREALVRPGKAALDYIAGKRKRYYNVFYLILLTLALLLFLRHFYEGLITLQSTESIPNPNEEIGTNKALHDIYSQRSKLLIFLFVPFAALSAFFVFGRKKLNLSEHSIIAGMLLLGMLLFSTFGHLFFYLNLIIEFSAAFANGISMFITAACLFYIGYGYYNVFIEDYSKWEFVFRFLLFFTVLSVEILILLLILIGFATNWTFTGSFNLNPMS